MNDSEIAENFHGQPVDQTIDSCAETVRVANPVAVHRLHAAVKAAEATDPALQRLQDSFPSRHASAMALLLSERESLRAENDRVGQQLGDLRRVYAACRSDLDASRAKIRRQSEALSDQQSYQDFRDKWEGGHCDLDATAPVVKGGQGRPDDHDGEGGSLVGTLIVAGLSMIVGIVIGAWSFARRGAL